MTDNQETARIRRWNDYRLKFVADLRAGGVDERFIKIFERTIEQIPEPVLTRFLMEEEGNETNLQSEL